MSNLGHRARYLAIGCEAQVVIVALVKLIDDGEPLTESEKESIAKYLTDQPEGQPLRFNYQHYRTVAQLDRVSPRPQPTDDPQKLLHWFSGLQDYALTNSREESEPLPAGLLKLSTGALHVQ